MQHTTFRIGYSSHLGLGVDLVFGTRSMFSSSGYITHRKLQCTNRFVWHNQSEQFIVLTCMHAYALVNNNIDRNGIGIGNGHKPKKTKKKETTTKRKNSHSTLKSRASIIHYLPEDKGVVAFFFVVSVRYAPKFHRIDGDLCS